MPFGPSVDAPVALLSVSRLPNCWDLADSVFWSCLFHLRENGVKPFSPSDTAFCGSNTPGAGLASFVRYTTAMKAADASDPKARIGGCVLPNFPGEHVLAHEGVRGGGWRRPGAHRHGE